MPAALFEAIVTAAEPYLGPAAERFIARQVKFHLGKKPEELSKEDLPKLVEWVKVSLAMLTEDKAMVAEFNQRVEKIGA